MERQIKFAVGLFLTTVPAVGTLYVLLSSWLRIYREGAFFGGIFRRGVFWEPDGSHLALWLILFTCICAYAGFGVLRRLREYLGREVPAQVESKQSIEPGFLSLKKFEVGYSYSIDGLKHSGRSVRSYFVTQKGADAFAARYDVGQWITIFVDPDRPENSVLPSDLLDPDKLTYIWLVSFFGVLGVATAILVGALLSRA